MNIDFSATRGAVRPPAALSLVIDKAISTSYHAGVAWLIVNGNDVVSGSSMAGYPNTSLFDAIMQSRGAKAVYLSSPPHPLFVDGKTLLDAMQRAGIWQLHIPKITEPWWDRLQGERLGMASGVKVLEHPVEQIGNQIYHGPYTLMTKKRPWVTGITISHLSGTNLSLNAFEEDAGVKFNVRGTIDQTHAVAVEEGTDERRFVSPTNAANGEVPVYRIYSVEDFKAVLRYQNLLKLPTLSLVGSTDFVRSLMKLDLVDDAVHYCMVLSGDSEQPKAGAPHTGVFPRLDGWLMTGSDVIERGVRINFSRALL